MMLKIRKRGSFHLPHTLTHHHAGRLPTKPFNRALLWIRFCRGNRITVHSWTYHQIPFVGTVSAACCAGRTIPKYSISAMIVPRIASATMNNTNFFNASDCWDSDIFPSPIIPHSGRMNDKAIWWRIKTGFLFIPCIFSPINREKYQQSANTRSISGPPA